MDPLKGLTPLALLFAAPATAATNVNDWSAEIREASARFALPEQWIREVMRIESDGRTEINGQPITSRSGAMGLMQLMPGTWNEMRRIYGLGSDPYDPHDNVIAGAAYLRAMVDQFGFPAALAAYDAGPARLMEFLTIGRPLPSETVSYLQRATKRLHSTLGTASSSQIADKTRHEARARKRRLVTRERSGGAAPAAAGAEAPIFAITRH